MTDNADAGSMASLQEADYGEGRDYNYGSPHLVHSSIRSVVERDLDRLVADQLRANGICRVLEIGGGHGTFTAHLVNSGATVTVTEMSRPSAERLGETFRGNDRVNVVYDPEGEATEKAEGPFELVIFVSVLHHIPDYEASVVAACSLVSPGGAFYCVQDPMWYPSRSRMNLIADRAAYFAWRLGQGNMRRGVATRLRRLRGRYDAAEPSDMIEYHVVRQGVNEKRLSDVLDERFDVVTCRTYWSTQSRFLQRLGERAALVSTFGITAEGARAHENETS